MLLVQNLFAKNLRRISFNSHYLLLLKSPRGIGQLGTLVSQLGMTKLVKDAYSDACKLPFSYLLIDLPPTTDSDVLLRSKILPGEDTVIYRS